jgi:hypothetical protein
MKMVSLLLAVPAFLAANLVTATDAHANQPVNNNILSPTHSTHDNTQPTGEPTKPSSSTSAVAAAGLTHIFDGANTATVTPTSASTSTATDTDSAEESGDDYDTVLRRYCKKPRCYCGRRNATKIAQINEQRKKKGCDPCNCDKRKNGAEGVSSMAGVGAAGAAVALAVGVMAFL